METSVEPKQTGGISTPTEFKRQKGRSAKITFKEWTDDQVKVVESNAIFHCWALRHGKQTRQGAEIRIPTMETVAICELPDGRVRMVNPEKVQFLDQWENKPKPPPPKEVNA